MALYEAPGEGVHLAWLGIAYTRGMDIDEQHRRILAQSRICHLCGHDGADAVDHILPRARGGGEESANKAPAHHFDPCPTCGLRCNRVKGKKILAPIPLRSASFVWPDLKN